MEISALEFMLQLAIILLVSKCFGLIMRKFGLPQVLGFIIAGIIIGPAIWSSLFNIDGWVIPVQENNILSAFAEIGVILVMFTAGLETDLDELKRTGFVSFLVALGGVLVPLGLGFGVSFLFIGNEGWLSCLFIGVIMCATSVGITVETLREMGKLKGKVGTTILSAAIIDDVIGIIVLTIVISLNGSGSNDNAILNAINPSANAIISILWMLAFFVVAILGGFGISKLFKHMEKKHPNTHRLPILSLVVCFIYAYVSEEVFGVADITGAFIAGIVLATNHKSAEYVDKKITVNSYMIFGPVFFANIGIKMSFSQIDWNVLWFGLTFVAVAIIAKIIGCGIMAKSCKFNLKDSVKIGIGMIARGEVALIVAQKGITAGLLDDKYLTIVVMLVLVSSLLAPILLKILFKNDDVKPLYEDKQDSLSEHALNASVSKGAGEPDKN